MNTMSEFGEWLVRARGEAGLTQSQLAERAGVHINTIKGIEAGSTRRPRADVASKLRDVLGEPVDPEQVREEGYDRHTQSFLDLMGAYLMALPPERRLARIFELTRHLVVTE